jgi:hypothetical protein
MATFVVYLVNSAGLGSGVRDTIRDRVAYLMSETIHRAGGLGVGTGGITGVEVRWEQSCPQGRTRRDVVIRFRSRAQDGENYVCRGTPDGGWEFGTQGDTSITGQGTRSVVYVPECKGGASPQGDVLGNIAYHELMHNKVNMGDEMHQQPDLLLGSDGDLGPALDPSDGDVRLLAPHLADEHTQRCP